MLVEFPVLGSCDSPVVPGGVAAVTIFRTRDIFRLPTCCGTQLATGPIFLKPGKRGYRLPLDGESVSYTYPHERSEHGVFIRHTIAGEKKNITVSDDLFQILAANERWVALLELNDGRFRLVGSVIRPLRFLGGGTYDADTAVQPFTSWRFTGLSLAPACFIDSDEWTAVDCLSLSAADFVGGDWFQDLDLTYLGVEVPTPATGGIVASIVVFDDATIAKVGGGFADTTTETGGQYFFDDGPWALAPGTYLVSIPMSVTLLDGSPCGFTFQYTLTVPEPPVPAGDFDPSFFDTSFFF